MSDERWKAFEKSGPKLRIKLTKELFDECERLRDQNERLTTTIREAAGKFKKAADIDSRSIIGCNSNGKFNYIAAGMARITQAAEEIENE